MQIHLYDSLLRASVSDLAKVGVLDGGIWILIGGNVEEIEAFRTEAEDVSLSDMEVLEGSSVDLSESRDAFGGRSGCTEGIGCGYPIGTDTIIGTAAGDGRGIGSPPVANGAVADDKLAVVVRPRGGEDVVRVRDVGCLNGDGQAGERDDRRRDLPSSGD